MAFSYTPIVTDQDCMIDPADAKLSFISNDTENVNNGSNEKQVKSLFSSCTKLKGADYPNTPSLSSEYEEGNVNITSKSQKRSHADMAHLSCMNGESSDEIDNKAVNLEKSTSRCASKSESEDKQTFSTVTNRPYTICVEGNIASGKTTLLNYLAGLAKEKNYPFDLITLSEPVSKWRDVNGCNALNMMYSDPNRHSFMFHSYVQLTMLQNHMYASDKQKSVKVMERSLYSDRYCFIQNLYNAQKLSDAEYAVLNEWHSWITSTQSVDVDKIIYLRTRPETCLKRLQTRSRQEENTIPLSYLQDLHDLHEDWLINKIHGVPASVIVVDGDLDHVELVKFYEQGKLDSVFDLKLF